MTMDLVDFYNSLLAQNPTLSQIRVNLAEHLLACKNFDGAVREASIVIDSDSSLMRARLIRAAAWKERRNFPAAVRDLEVAASLHPENAPILTTLATCYAEIGLLAEAERTLRKAVDQTPRSVSAQLNLSSVLIRLERLAEAEVPCRAALGLNSALVEAHQNLSVILAENDPAAARYHRDAAYQRQQIFIDTTPDTDITVLVLAAADAANVPLQHLVSPRSTTLIRWYVEYATENQDRELPRYDLIFNGIGEADLAPALTPPVARALNKPGAIVLNHPDRVARTTRDNLPNLLAGIPGVLVSPLIRMTDAPTDPWEILQRSGLSLPVIFRPLGAHGGQGVRRIDDAADLRRSVTDPGYFAEFVDYRSADGWFRKYRFIFVDGCPYPYHLAISRDWLVHYWTAGMAGDPARQAEEQRFLADPEAELGIQALTALRTIATRLELDFGGIDFGMMPDGRIVVFEANATMLVHPESARHLVYRNHAVQVIQQAFRTMLASRLKGSCPDPV